MTAFTDKHFTIVAYNGNGTSNSRGGFTSPFATVDEALATVERARVWRDRHNRPPLQYKIFACERVMTLTPQEWSE